MRDSSVISAKGQQSGPILSLQPPGGVAGIRFAPVKPATAIPRSQAPGWRLTLSVAMIVSFSTMADAGDSRAEPADFAEFTAAVEAFDENRASSLGESIFAALKQGCADNSGLRAFESRLKAAEFLAGQMRQQLARAATSQLSSVVGGIAGGEDRPRDAAWMTIAPAKRFYETSARAFSSPVPISGLDEKQKSFLAGYYDFRLRSLVAAVAHAGQALAIAEPGFTSTYDYVLVLPLLHVSDNQPVNVDVLPSWMRGPEQLTALSDSCLFHFELPFQAMTIVRRSFEMQGKTFSESRFYRSAAWRCGGSRARVAVDCLQKAMAAVPEEQADLVVDIRFDIVQTWLASGNYLLGAGAAREIFEKYPSHSSAARALWLHYYALSRNGNAEEILANIDSALADDRCRPYEPRLLYIKWWALRRQRNQSARVAALEYDLLRRYGNDPMVAPILLSRATDLLASQSYGEACEILQQLVQRFPSAQAAVQARRMLERLKTTEKR